jgi:V/A-type H+-transporting ATPase subunit C
MLFWPAKEYGNINTRIRAKKAAFLGFGEIEKFLHAVDFEEFMNFLDGTSYANIIHEEAPQGVFHPDELSTILAKDLVQVVTNIKRPLRGKVRKFLEAYMEMFTAENLKTIVRGIHADMDKEEIFSFVIPLTSIQSHIFELIVEAETVKDFVEKIPYKEIKERLLLKMPLYEELNSTAPLEVTIEEWYLDIIKSALNGFPKSDQKRMTRIFETRVILRNILTMLRVFALKYDIKIAEMSMIHFNKTINYLNKRILQSTSWDELFSEIAKSKFRKIGRRIYQLYEATHDLIEVELLIDDYLAQQMKQQLSGYPFHLGIIAGFISMKHYEIKNLVSIGLGVEKGEPPDEIMKMITLL